MKLGSYQEYELRNFRFQKIVLRALWCIIRVKLGRSGDYHAQAVRDDMVIFETAYDDGDPQTQLDRTRFYPPVL